MFEHFEQSLFDDPNFKEDSVREVIIAPMLSKLGYHATGDQTVTRSKSLDQPFIYTGTRKHPVTIIPDYTLNFMGSPVAILDAKSPVESVSSTAHIQQAYSYAIRPEIRTKHFTLCNGRRLAVYSVDSPEPLLDLPFEEFEARWNQIEKHLAPKYLLQPELRNLRPDFGFKVSRLGLADGAELIMVAVRLGMFAQVNQSLYSATVDTQFVEEAHCVSFDFRPDQLLLLVAGLPEELKKSFLGALTRAPFQAGADLELEVDLRCHMGELVQVEHECFIPLVIDEVLGSRFLPASAPPGGNDIPPHIFRLSKAYKLQHPEERDA